jgi:actin-related protein
MYCKIHGQQATKELHEKHYDKDFHETLIVKIRCVKCVSEEKKEIFKKKESERIFKELEDEYCFNADL